MLSKSNPVLPKLNLLYSSLVQTTPTYIFLVEILRPHYPRMYSVYIYISSHLAVVVVESWYQLSEVELLNT